MTRWNLLSLLVVASSVIPAFATVPVYGQCGGKEWTGETVCETGSVCTASDQWYSQCKPGVATSVSSSAISSSTTVSSTTSASVPAATGFVKTSGTKFTLNGSKYTVVGTNSYWVGLSLWLSDANINLSWSDIAKSGATTVRTWGFNEVSTIPANDVYYQSWSGATPTINTGANGLAHFDKVVAAAKANGLRLIVPLTNNWGDYGGMDVYVNQILGAGSAHDLFYTNAKVIAAFKSYIKTFVTRYKNEPTILAWELANEPRCKGSTGSTSGTCTTATITAWAKDISAYIKSIDSNHLVGLGDEGFFNQPGNPSYPYQGAEGIDFAANLAISTLDFGTFHLYPVPWGATADPTAWGTQWIADHAALQKSVGKPVIIEEFGLDADDQVTPYKAWLGQVISSGLAGDLIWQAGTHFSDGSSSWDDGYAVYPDGPVYPLLQSHAAALKARA